jgi:hypothetical protein
MKLSHIINTIIIIMILHLILININFKKYFNFNNGDIGNGDIGNGGNLGGMNSDGIERDDNLEEFYEKSPQDELLDFINSDILPSNSYSSSNNDSNFSSNVTKTQDFYDIEKSVELNKSIKETPSFNDDKFSEYLECKNIEQNQMTSVTDLRAGKDEAIYHNPI